MQLTAPTVISPNATMSFQDGIKAVNESDLPTAAKEKTVQEIKTLEGNGGLMTKKTVVDMFKNSAEMAEASQSVLEAFVTAINAIPASGQE